jgi:hypothetical protein
VNEEGGGASRSTSPAAGTSSATDVSLRDHLTTLIQAAEQRSDQRFDAMKEMVDTAFQTAQTAINKAEEATEKRFEGVNEFRAALSDQALQFVQKQTLTALTQKLEAQIERNREDLDQLSKRIDLSEGQAAGSRLTWGNMAALVATAAAFIGIIVVLANYLSSH